MSTARQDQQQVLSNASGDSGTEEISSGEDNGLRRGSGKKVRRGRKQGIANLPVSGVDEYADKAVVAGSAAVGGNKKKDTLRLRLELNLDVEITLQAKIRGDLELALLQ